MAIQAGTFSGRHVSRDEGAQMTKIDRRAFLGTVAAASAFTIVPRHVLGGPRYQAPSDMILFAQVGRGLPAQRQVNTGLASRTDLLFVAGVGSNKKSHKKIYWGGHG